MRIRCLECGAETANLCPQSYVDRTDPFQFQLRILEGRLGVHAHPIPAVSEKRVICNVLPGFYFYGYVVGQFPPVVPETAVDHEPQGVPVGAAEPSLLGHGGPVRRCSRYQGEAVPATLRHDGGAASGGSGRSTGSGWTVLIGAFTSLFQRPAVPLLAGLSRVRPGLAAPTARRARPWLPVRRCRLRCE
jgi:hypothetical protein